MRILLLEIRRILCSRRNIILLLAGLVLSVVMGIVPIGYEYASYMDSDGNIVSVNGRDAIEYRNSLYEPIEGDVTPEKMVYALTQYQEAAREAGGMDPLIDDDFPRKIYLEKISPVWPLLSTFNSFYDETGSGRTTPMKNISPETGSDFYKLAEEYVTNLAEREYGSPDIVETVTEMYRQIDTPFQLYGCYSSGALDYIIFNILILFLICVAISAPVFSENYENGSDYILRCTRYGRRHCAGFRLLSLVLILVIYYLVCMGIQIGIMNQAFGADSLKTSVQMVWQIIAPISLNIGELQITTVFGGLLSLLSGICFALFISARVRSAMVSMLISLLMAILPTLLYFAGASWLAFLWPSSGIGLNNSFMYQIQDIGFLTIGDRGIWVPWVIITAAAVELVVFAVLSIRTYCKHQVV